MDAVLVWIIQRPMVCATISALSLVDAANCVRLDHADWWVPAAVAFVSAIGVRRHTLKET